MLIRKLNITKSEKDKKKRRLNTIAAIVAVAISIVLFLALNGFWSKHFGKTSNFIQVVGITYEGEKKSLVYEVYYSLNSCSNKISEMKFKYKDISLKELKIFCAEDCKRGTIPPTECRRKYNKIIKLNAGDQFLLEQDDPEPLN